MSMVSAPNPDMTEEFSRQNPFPAVMKANDRINQPGSGKETRHIVLDLKESGLSYEPGDSLGIFPQNPPTLVEEFIQKLELDREHSIDGTPLKEILCSCYALNRANKKFVKTVIESGHASPALAGMDEAGLDEYIFTRDYIDILNECPDFRTTPEELLSLLTPISPRLYSIASSFQKHPGEAHLTLAVVFYQTHGRDKYGLASGYLSEFVPLGQTVPAFIQPHRQFRLPQDNATNIMMVGPGTGIAPFRSFLEQREVENAPGRNWLFFGDRNAATDFLYRDELEALQKKDILTHLTTAFSRDQEQKIYVQDRLREHGAEVWDWLQNGASFYICGDARRMAKDVNQALLDIAQQHGGMSPDEAAAYLYSLKQDKRYLRDVY